MAIYSTRRATSIASSLAVGGLLCFGIFSFLLAATIVLSLIPIYTPDHSDEGFGDQFQIEALILKAVYQNGSFAFSNGTVLDSATVSNLCGSTYRIQGAKNFAGCVATKFRAYGPSNTSTNSRRRRRALTTYAGLYEIGQINLYYSTTCGNGGDKLQYANSTKLSACVKSRLTACNNLVNGSSQSPDWALSSGSFVQMIMRNDSMYYQAVVVERLFAIPFLSAVSLANSLQLSNDTITNITMGCQYIGPLSHGQIAQALTPPSIVTSTQPTTSELPIG